MKRYLLICLLAVAGLSSCKGFETVSPEVFETRIADGKAQLVAARCLYNYEPAKFYKWWSRNEEKVYMTSSEKIKLFLKVESLKAGTVSKKHLELMDRLRVGNKK